MLQQGLLDPTFVYTGATDFEDIADAYQRVNRREHVKLLVRTAAGRQQMDASSRVSGIRGVTWRDVAHAARESA